MSKNSNGTPSYSFGFQNVTSQEKTQRVNALFTSVADRYDLMNDLMSAGLHRCWKDKFVRHLRPHPGLTHLDMAGGTGDIAFRIYKTCKNLGRNQNSPQIIVCDQNESMLLQGRKRALDKGIVNGITWVQGDAAAPPFKENFFDSYSISFGLRNVTELDSALVEAKRVLKPGGTYYCMEFSPLKYSSLFTKAYRLYANHVIPKLGEVITGDRQAYQYLIESIERFPTKKELCQKLQSVGFEKVTFSELNGGLVAIHSAQKPC